MALPSTDRRAPLDGRATWLVAGGLRLPATLRRRLLLQPLAQPFPAALPVGAQGRSDRPLGRHQPTHCLAPAGRLVQGSDSGRAPPPGRAAAWQTAAPLCRPHCRVHPYPPPGHALRRARLHPTHLERPRVHGGLASLHQEVWPRSGDTPGGQRRPAGRRSGGGAVCRARRGPAQPTGPAAAAPFFATTTQYAGAFLLMPAALAWLATAQDCFADDYGSLRQGLLTSVFALVVGLERIFHLDEMADLGFARLCGGRRCPSRYPIGGWRRHLAWYEVDAFCRRTCPWHLLRDEDVMVSFDEHTIPRWTKKFRLGKGYVT